MKIKTLMFLITLLASSNIFVMQDAFRQFYMDKKVFVKTVTTMFLVSSVIGVVAGSVINNEGISGKNVDKWTMREKIVYVPKLILFNDGNYVDCRRHYGLRITWLGLGYLLHKTHATNELTTKTLFLSLGCIFGGMFIR